MNLSLETPCADTPAWLTTYVPQLGGCEEMDARVHALALSHVAFRDKFSNPPRFRRDFDSIGQVRSTATAKHT